MELDLLQMGAEVDLGERGGGSGLGIIAGWLVADQSVFKPGAKVTTRQKGRRQVKITKSNLEADVTSKIRRELFGGVGPR